ncbi:MAG: hypothetical protein KKH08_07430 [Candidatus Omnitrophica bacterium]|nr:hypothetical protein [Candidatus Omnitrophota bacterium]
MKKNIALNIWIALAVILLLTVIFIFSNRTSEKPQALKEVTAVNKTSVTKTAIPSPKPYDANYDYAEQEKALPEEIAEPEKEDSYEEEVMLLKDLDLDSIAKEKRPPESPEEQKTQLKTQPSIEDMKRLQQKNIIIY